MKKLHFVFFLILFALRSISWGQDSLSEMRGVWIATVKNLDFPSSRFLAPEEQKKEYIQMLDHFAEIGINAVMFQVRPAGDAFYDSSYEPWSEWLTGKQGQAPEPYYDPLQFYIEEAHKRKIEFHAWINPFRAVATVDFADIAPEHLVNQKPEWFFIYDINKYFNPGIPEVRRYICKIIADICRRYEIDGIHFDDYFYPYPVYNEQKKISQILDYESYIKYNPKEMTRADWRRENLNLFIEQVHDTIKNIKPHLRFGVSPSGIWRNKKDDPKGSHTNGFSHYDNLYCDPLLWLKKSWIDYVAPQIYWTSKNKRANFRTLVDWWSKHTYGKQLYIGHAVYLANPDSPLRNWQDAEELPRQVQMARENPKVSGSIFYKAASIINNPMGFADFLRYDFYREKALLPSFFKKEEEKTDSLPQAEKKKSLCLCAPPEDFYSVRLGKDLMLSWSVENEQNKNLIDSFFVYRCRLESGKVELYRKSKVDYIIISKKERKKMKGEYGFYVTCQLSDKKESAASNTVFLTF